MKPVHLEGQECEFGCMANKQRQYTKEIFHTLIASR